jgi:hypothetical protein
MEGILGEIAKQWPVAVFMFIVVVFLLRREEKIEKDREERRERERKFQAEEAEKQRVWNEEQGKKRDEFQRDVITHTNRFVKALAEDQQKSVSLLNQSMELISSKQDLVLERINHHHNFAEKSINEITKWKDGIAIRRKADAE